MQRRVIAILVGLALSPAAFADVVLLAADAGKDGHHVKLGDKVQRQALAKSDPGHSPHTGEVALIDGSGLEYFFNTDITIATASSASGAASEASYTHAVNASTLAGGVASTTLTDAFDGYGALCVSTNGGTGPCVAAPPRGGVSYVMYNQNGAGTLDAACSNRQVILAPQVVGSLTMQRKVYVPAGDEFARWLNIFTNTGGTSISFNMITSNNLGSDTNTQISTTSSGDAVASSADLWVASFQNFSGSTSTDPRLAHVFGGPGAPSPIAGLTFVNGNGYPFWWYTLTLAPGETKIIANFVSGQESRAAAAAKGAELTTFSASQQACMSAAELGQVVNFANGPAAAAVAVPFADHRVLAALAALTAALGALALRSRRA